MLFSMKNKKYYRYILTLVLSFLFVGISIIPTNAQLIKKEFDSVLSDSNGTILYVGGSEPGNYSKIQDAIDNASDGDMVFVYEDSSPYFENVYINKSILLIGENKDTTTIRGEPQFAFFATITIITDKVTVCNFTIEKNSSSYFFEGIYILSSDNIITQNKIQDNSQGISLKEGATNNTISHNTIRRNRFYGIYVYDSTHNTISNNYIMYNRYAGICLKNASYNNIKNNIISSNLIGISIEETLFESNENHIHNNHIDQNHDYGITIRRATGTLIENNNISRSEIGIDLFHCSSTYIKNNNFITNILPAFFEDSYNNIWMNNYWNRPRILPKLIRGVRSFPYPPTYILIPWKNIDLYPAKTLNDT